MKCPVAKISLSDHPTNPNMQIGNVAGHTVVVGRHYDEGTLGFYIPPGAIIPDKIAEEMWLKGKLAGAKKNRVKAREIQGVASEGLFYGSRYWVIQDGQSVYVESPSWNPSWG
jgi:hypothetical protein